MPPRNSCCGKRVCECRDRFPTIDTQSEPGSWTRHARDTDCMRHRASPGVK